MLSSATNSSPSLDLNTTLCLACSSSLPPLKSKSAKSIFTTKCCRRPICPSCINTNPRLARYDPCLACLAGVSVLSSSSGQGLGQSTTSKTPLSPNMILNGAVRDEDTFILGDDEDEEDEEGYGTKPFDEPSLPPPYELEAVDQVAVDAEFSTSVQAPPPLDVDEIGPTETDGPKTTPYKYYINRSDTLQGISLRFGVNSREICNLNNLPPSVMSTTPHLLHTRSFLLLPPATKPHPSLSVSAAAAQGREEKLVRERAEKKLQTLTKEVDWRIAKAYVALADDGEDQAMHGFKRKEMQPDYRSKPGLSGGLEELAIERYLDDEEWEAQETKAGRGVQVQKFPFADFGRGGKAESSSVGNWWWAGK